MRKCLKSDDETVEIYGKYTLRCVHSVQNSTLQYPLFMQCTNYIYMYSLLYISLVILYTANVIYSHSQHVVGFPNEYIHPDSIYFYEKCSSYY